MQYALTLTVITKNNNLILYKVEATFFSEVKLKPKNIICGCNVDFFNVKRVAVIVTLALNG